MEASLEAFRRLGVTVVDIELPDFSRLSAMAAVLHAAEANPFHDEWFRTRPQDYSAQVRERLERGRPDARARLREGAAGARSGDRRVLRGRVFKGGRGARAGGVVPDADHRRDGHLDRRGRGADARSFVRLTRPISYLGLPVVVANAGFTREGMPIGMQLIAPPLDEASALRAAHAFQRATEWHLRAPRE